MRQASSTPRSLCRCDAAAFHLAQVRTQGARVTIAARTGRGRRQCDGQDQGDDQAVQGASQCEFILAYSFGTRECVHVGAV
eukprot:690835-Prymnesium_polylepis.1